MSLPLAPGIRLPGGPAPGGQRLELCRTFRRLSMRTYNWLTTGRPDLVPNETSITDFNLLVLRRRHPQELLIHRFTNRQEPLTGGDWEWWFGSPGRWAGTRIQAKKLDAAGRRYLGLDKSVGDPAERQIDILRQSSRRDGLPAAYVFYNGAPETTVKWRASPCLSANDWERGCAIASATNVQQKIDVDSDLVSAIAPISLPWGDLLCCKKAAGLADQVAGQLRSLGEETGAIRDQLPDYVEHLFNPDARTGPVPAEVVGVAVLLDNPGTLEQGG